MEIRNPALDFAFSLGNVGGVTIRVSYFFPALIIVCLIRLGVPLGLIVSAILVASVLFHEFCHIWGARATGGSGDEIFLWPLGGLAMVRPAPNMAARVVTSLLGPISNLAICLACVPTIVKAGVLRQCLNPLLLPSVNLEANWGLAVQQLAFSLNWMLFLVNLLPILPFDGGQIVLAFLERNRPRLESRLRAVIVSLFGGVIVAFAGLALDSTTLVTLSTFMLLLNLNDFWKTRLSLAVQLDSGSDSGFMGYDFSQGYTSLEKEAEEEEEDTQVQPTVSTREDRRRQREAEERAAAEQRLDELLEKVHKQGMESLTEEERRFLQQASSRYRRS